MDFVRIAHNLVQFFQVRQPFTGIHLVQSIQHVHFKSTMQIPRIELSDNPERVCQDIASYPFGHGSDHKRTWLKWNDSTRLPTRKGLIHKQFRIANPSAPRASIDGSQAKNALTGFRFLRHTITLSSWNTIPQFYATHRTFTFKIKLSFQQFRFDSWNSIGIQVANSNFFGSFDGAKTRQNQLIPLKHQRRIGLTVVIYRGYIGVEAITNRVHFGISNRNAVIQQFSQKSRE